MIRASIFLLSTLASLFKIRRELVLENLALRQQLATYKRCHHRPGLQPTDRLFWVWLAKIWTDWRSVLLIVKIEFFEQQSVIAGETGGRRGEGLARLNLSQSLYTLNQHAEAVTQAEAVPGILDEIESPQADKIRKHLAAWCQKAADAEKPFYLSTTHPAYEPKRAFELNLQYQ